MLFLRNGTLYCHETCLADSVRVTLQYHILKLSKYSLIANNYVYIACDKECTMATRVPNPISLYCT